MPFIEGFDSYTNAFASLDSTTITSLRAGESGLSATTTSLQTNINNKEKDNFLLKEQYLIQNKIEAVTIPSSGTLT